MPHVEPYRAIVRLWANARRLRHAPYLSGSLNRLSMRIDVHQHLWPPSFVAALRARRRPPCLEGWTLVLSGGERWEIDPAAHDVDRRTGSYDLILLAPSAALGIDRLPPAE